MAEIDFELGWFEGAAAEYESWARRHPTDPQVDLARTRASAARCRLDEKRCASERRPPP